MASFLKRLSLIAAGVLGIAAAGVIVAVLLVDPGRYQLLIEDRVKRDTGGELDIVGGLELSLVPAPALKVGRSVLRDPQIPGGDPLLAFERLTLRLDPWPLFRGTLALSKIRVEGLALDFRHRPGGGLSHLLALAGRPGRGASPLPALGTLEVRNASAVFAGPGGDGEIRLSGLNLRTGDLAPGRPVTVDAGFHLAAPGAGVDGRVELSARGSPRPGAGDRRPAVESPELRWKQAGIPGPDSGWLRGDRLIFGEVIELAGVDARTGFATVEGGDERPMRLHARRFILGTASARARLEEFGLAAFGLEVSGHLEARGPLNDPELSGRVRVARFEPRALLAALGRPAPGDAAWLPQRAGFEAHLDADRRRLILDFVDLALDPVRIRGRVRAGLARVVPLTLDLTLETPGPGGGRLAFGLDSTLSADIPGRSMETRSLALTLGALSARGAFEAADTGAGLRFSGRLEVAEFDPRLGSGPLFPEGLKPRDPHALSRVRGQASFSGNAATLRLDPLVVEVDDTRIDGSASLTRMSGATPALRITLKADRIDALRYLPRETDDSPPLPLPPPGELLPGIDLSGRLIIGQLRFGDTLVRDLALTVDGDGLGLAPPRSRTAIRAIAEAPRPGSPGR